jgi:glycosyltransferase involved in cell wall biosynthesis
LITQKGIDLTIVSAPAPELTTVGSSAGANPIFNTLHVHTKSPETISTGFPLDAIAHTRVMTTPAIPSPAIIIVATVAVHLRSFHLPWVRYLRASGFHLCGVASDITNCVDCQDAFDQVMDIPFSRSATSFKQAFLVGKALRQLTSSLGTSLVHFHTPNAAFWGRLALRNEVTQRKCKVAYTAHGFHFHANGGALPNFIYERAERLVSRHTHALLTINAEDAAAARRFKLAPGGFHQHVPGAGVHLARFDPSRFDPVRFRSAIARSLGLPLHSRFVLMVAEFIPRKRHLDALTAFAQENLPDTHLLFAGAGPEEENVRQCARRQNLDGRVHFLGNRQDIPELLAASRLVILPSEREGLPVCLLEAMAMEKPIVVADARGSRELVASDCGWTHAIGDTRQLGSLIRTVLNNPNEAGERARRGREKVKTQYAWPAVQDTLVSVYRRLGVAFPSADNASEPELCLAAS